MEICPTGGGGRNKCVVIHGNDSKKINEKVDRSSLLIPFWH